MSLSPGSSTASKPRRRWTDVTDLVTRLRDISGIARATEVEALRCEAADALEAVEARARVFEVNQQYDAKRANAAEARAEEAGRALREMLVAHQDECIACELAEGLVAFNKRQSPDSVDRAVFSMDEETAHLDDAADRTSVCPTCRCMQERRALSYYCPDEFHNTAKAYFSKGDS
jgi:hypothetical protein